VASSDFNGYCGFTKAIEHLGDRWTLLIVRELGVFGPQGFNALAAGLPGRISRSVLADRLRRLEDLGLVARGAGRTAQYRLTDAGADLVPTILSLRGWADAWLPDDPAMALRDPAVILAWLGERVQRSMLPEEAVVLEVTMRHGTEYRGWLVLQRGADPYGCIEDPMLEESRYVYLEAGTPVMIGLARGHREWSRAVQDGSLRAYGDPRLVRALPSLFRPSAGRRAAAQPATRATDSPVLAAPR